MTEVVTEPGAFRARCEAARARGQRVGLVPTMGALHLGHLSLVRCAQQHANYIALSIFVNPLQFGPRDDFDRYPRSLDDDVRACMEAGVDVVFAPSRDALYPEGFGSLMRVSSVTGPLEGVHRPGHFDGVTTIVAKLFNLTGRATAVFGKKDYQQLKTLERLAIDLDFPIAVVGAPIVREADGLALSSRNRYLSAEERSRALALAEGLRAAHAAFSSGERSSEKLSALARAPVDAAFDRVDYVALADADRLTAARETLGERTVLAMAAHLGTTRLIDNVVLGEDPSP